MNRILILAMGLIIGFAAIYFGDGLRGWWTDYNVSKAISTLTNDEEARGIFVIFAVAACLVLGSVSWCYAMRDLSDGNPIDGRSPKKSFQAAGALIFFCALFGTLAAPFSFYGPYPWQWASMWDVIPLFALMPTVLLGYAIVTISSREEQEDRSAQVINFSSSRFRRPR